MLSGAIKQLSKSTMWGELDYLLIDMPPGTGDAQLTISQTAPLTGAIIVTTPQEVALIDARKGLQMFENVSVPILGVVENMAGFVCGSCEHVTPLFQQGGGQKMANEAEVPLLGSIPLDPRVAAGGDSGDPLVNSHPDSIPATVFTKVAEAILSQCEILNSQQGEKFKPLSLEW